MGRKNDLAILKKCKKCIIHWEMFFGETPIDYRNIVIKQIVISFHIPIGNIYRTIAPFLWLCENSSRFAW